MSLAISRAKYTGDAMRGYGYMGDPGWKDFFKKAARTAVSFIPGVGPALDLGLDMYESRTSTPQAGPGSIPFAPPAATPGVGFPGFGPGAAPGTSVVPFQAQLPACPTNGSMAGYHLNKSDYFLRNGTFVQKGTKYVKNRKRNPANARATSRAISRVVGAKRYATSLQRISIRKSK